MSFCAFWLCLNFFMLAASSFAAGEMQKLKIVYSSFRATPARLLARKMGFCELLSAESE